MKIGLHLSIAGGYPRSLERAKALGCEAVQIFLQNPRGWRWRAVGEAESAAFRRGRVAAGVALTVAHLSYLPNLAAVDADLQARSRERLRAEVELARRLGIDFFVCHPGHATLEEASLARVTAALEEAAAGPRPPWVLVENTAGQKGELGCRLEQLHQIIAGSRHPVGLCLDSAHAFAAGYDIREPAVVAGMLAEMAAGPGLAALKMLHLNDALYPCNSHRDRHWHLGEGQIGAVGLRNFVRAMAPVVEAAILETPKKLPGDDARNLAMARRLAGQEPREMIIPGAAG